MVEYARSIKVSSTINANRRRWSIIGTLGQSLDEYTSAVQQVYEEKYERLPQPKTKASNKESLDPNWSKIHHKKNGNFILYISEYIKYEPL